MSASELTNPDGEEWDSYEDGCGNCAHSVGPAARAVHQPIKQAQLPLEERCARRVQDDLKVTLQET